jgi:hypothetical protein
MKMTHLFLDDERCPKDVTWLKLPEVKWTITRTSNQFKHRIEHNGMPKTISFDHDIQDYSNDNKEVTGYDLLKWLCGYCIEKYLLLPKIYFHTQKSNRSGKYAGILGKFSKI